MAKNTMVLKTKSDKPVITGPVLHATKDLEDIKEGDPLSSDAIQVKYLRLWTNADGADDDIDLPSETLLNIVHAVTGDNHASWEKRADEARREHNKAHPIPDQSLSIPANVKELAGEADEELGNALFEFVEAAKKTKYGPLMVMHALEECYESSIDQWPMPDNDTKDGKPEDNPNYKWNGGIPAYDRGYRAKPKGEKGVPSWYADFFDSLPDIGGHRFGQTIAADKLALAKARDKAQTDYSKKDADASIADLNKERTAAITLIKRAMKLRFKLAAIGPIVMTEATINNGKDKIKVRAKETGLKNAGYIIRIDPRTNKIMRTLCPIALQDVGSPEPRTEFKSVGQLLAMTPEGLPEDCTFQNLLDSGGSGTQEESGEEEGTAVFKDVDTASAGLMIVEASLQDTHFSGVLQHAVRMKNKKTGRYLNMALVDTLISIRTALDSIGPSLAEIKAEDDKVKDKLNKQQEQRTAEAMAREGKAATA